MRGCLKRVGSLGIIIVLVIAGRVAYVHLVAAHRYPAGVLAPDAPLQTAPESRRTWTSGDFVYTPLAAFELDARVLSKRRYDDDRESEVAPYDLLVGWQNMSDQTILDAFTFGQSRRFGNWRSNKLPIAEREVNESMTNIHIVPATDAVRRIVADLKRGDMVRLRGVLVSIANTRNTFRWESSLTRTDTGKGACELLWLETVEVLPPESYPHRY
jgi:hypothetical protein